MHRTLSVLCVVALALAVVAAPAAAAPVSPAAATYLAEHPGGKITGRDEITYDGGTFVVNITPPEHLDGYADCPVNWFCFYDRPDFGYPRGKLSSCYWQSLVPYGWQDRIESAHYNLSRGSATFFDHGVELFTVSTGYRSKAYVGSVMNRATDVYRFC